MSAHAGQRPYDNRLVYLRERPQCMHDPVDPGLSAHCTGRRTTMSKTRVLAISSGTESTGSQQSARLRDHVCAAADGPSGSLTR